MAEREAAELILLGPYVDCHGCKGTGFSYGFEKCMICNYAGKLTRPGFREACILLGLPPPEDPHWLFK